MQNANQVFAIPPAQLGVRYNVGAEVGLRFERNLAAAADRAVIQLETNGNGYLYAWARGEGGAWRPLTTLSTVRMQSNRTPPVRPGEKEVLILFSLQARPNQAAPASPEPATNLVEKDGDVTYVVYPCLEPPASRCSSRYGFHKKSAYARCVELFDPLSAFLSLGRARGGRFVESFDTRGQRFGTVRFH